jgi:hypothetical protein
MGRRDPRQLRSPIHESEEPGHRHRASCGDPKGHPEDEPCAEAPLLWTPWGVGALKARCLARANGSTGGAVPNALVLALGAVLAQSGVDRGLGLGDAREDHVVQELTRLVEAFLRSDAALRLSTVVNIH